MASPAIQTIYDNLESPNIYFFGSKVSCEYYREFPDAKIITIKNRKKIFESIGTLNRFSKYDYFISFRSSFRTKFIKNFIKAKFKFQFSGKGDSHQVLRYLNFTNEILNLKQTNEKKPLLNFTSIKKFDKDKLVIGISPGAKYGSAKRWDPFKYAEVIKFFSSGYLIKLLGSSADSEIAREIIESLHPKEKSSSINLVGKTNIADLISQVSSLDILITGDSGIMHIGAALQIPTVAIFGPTNENITSQWLNKKSIIVKNELECRPCMRRECPFNHQRCMNDINSDDVIKAIKELLRKM